jgi:hypothetical protein
MLSLYKRVASNNPTFYEQVTEVNGWSLFFCSLGFASCFGFALHVALHRVSIRTLEELPFEELGASWGSRGESMLPLLGRS